jgi:Domain of unknown function (DUF4878)
MRVRPQECLSVRYHPPPNWPKPPDGWTPPPGWQPDPSWPPPPQGWQVWLPERRTRRMPIVVGGIVAVAAAAVTVIVLAIPHGPKPSDEEQIRAVVAGMQDAWNRTDFDAYRGYLCKDNQRFWAALGADNAGASTMLQRGRAEFTVHSVDVSGDKAQASVKETYSNGDEPPETTEHFVHEDGNWKLCETKLMNTPEPRLQHT